MQTKLKILIIIDVHERDLKEYSLVGFHLASKHSCEVIFSSTKNEISEMIRRRPHVIVLSHLQYKRFGEVITTARQMGVKICIMPPEGIPAMEEAVMEIYGDSSFVPFVDLFLSWGPEVTAHLQKKIPSKQIHTVGCARFDTYHQRFFPLFRNKESFCEAHGFNSKLPIVTWVSSGGYLDRGVQDALDLTRRVSELGKKAWNRERIESQWLTFGIIKDFLSRYLKDYPGTINLAYRPHPLEGFEIIKSFKEAHPEVKLIDPKDPLEETLFHSAVYVGFPCTAAIESWVQNPSRMSLFIRHPNFKGELEFQKQILSLAEVADDYENFKQLLNRCLEGFPISEEQVQKRKEIVFRYLYKSDGESAARCAHAIAKLAAQIKRPAYSAHQMVPLLRMMRNRLITGHWLGMKRNPGHHKYFPPSRINDWFSKFSLLYPETPKKLNYHLDL